MIGDYLKYRVYYLADSDGDFCCLPFCAKYPVDALFEFVSNSSLLEDFKDFKSLVVMRSNTLVSYYCDCWILFDSLEFTPVSDYYDFLRFNFN